MVCADGLCEFTQSSLWSPAASVALWIHPQVDIRRDEGGLKPALAI